MSAPDQAALARAANIALSFEIEEPVEACDFPEKGNMSHEMYLVLSGPSSDRREYLLQRMNSDVFTQPARVIGAMQACTQAQRRYLRDHPLPDGERWDTIDLVPTCDGGRMLEIVDDENTRFWRMMVRIQGCRAFKSLSEVETRERQLRIAEEAGRGLARFGDFTSQMDALGLTTPLPGYRDTRLYYDQLDSVLAGNRTLADVGPYLPRDPMVREGTQYHFRLHVTREEHARRLSDPELRPFIDLVQSQRALAMTLLERMESGEIRKVAIHGDTKLDNFLFDLRTDRARALVDLDTIMPHTWLADWGDMARSLVNVAGEKEPNLAAVKVDAEIFQALASGFLSTAREVTPSETGLMVDAVRVIALELGTRFLADYLRGDSYFGLGSNDPPDLNRTRAMVQLTLFQRLTAERDKLQAFVGAELARR